MEGNDYNYMQVFKAAEKACLKRKKSDMTLNQSFSSPEPEAKVMKEGFVPQTSNAVTQILHEPTFTNSYSNHFSNTNQYNMIPPYLYPYPQWPLPSVPPRLCAPLPNTDAIAYETNTIDQISNGPHVALSENNAMYGMSTGADQYKPYQFATNCKPVIRLLSCVLYPPSPAAKFKRNEKPPGCRTVFIGGLPGNITETIVREAFGLCGKIVTVRMNTKSFCHVRFSCQEEVEQAFYLSGYRMKIENKDELPFSGKLHVDYAVAKDDQHEAECAERLALRRARHQVQKEQEALELNKPRVNPFSEVELQNLLAQFRNSNFKDGIHTLNTWLQKGEVQKRNAGTFFTILQSLNHYIKKLLFEKESCKESVIKAKVSHRQNLHDISIQLEDFKKIFDLAEKQKNWDHFTKSQRKTIELWKRQTSEIKEANFEQLIDERIEDEMELSDEEKPVSEDITIKEEVKLLRKQINETNNAVDSLERDIASLRKEQDDSLEALSQNLSSQKKTLDDMQKDYDNRLALHKKTLTPKQNPPPANPAHSVDVESFRDNARLLSLIGQFLLVHPFGVNISYICSYLDKIVPSVSSVRVSSLMHLYPSIFIETVTGIGPTLERKWTLQNL